MINIKFDRERDFRDFEFRRSRDLFLSLDFRSRERFDRDLRRERLRFLDFDLDFDLEISLTLPSFHRPFSVLFMTYN